VLGGGLVGERESGGESVQKGWEMLPFFASYTSHPRVTTGHTHIPLLGIGRLGDRACSCWEILPLLATHQSPCWGEGVLGRGLGLLHFPFAQTHSRLATHESTTTNSYRDNGNL
jgi:hypothetical protein